MKGMIVQSSRFYRRNAAVIFVHMYRDVSEMAFFKQLLDLLF